MVECWPRNLAVVGSNPTVTQDSFNVVVFVYNYISSFIVCVQPITGLVHFSPLFSLLSFSQCPEATGAQFGDRDGQLPQEHHRRAGEERATHTHAQQGAGTATVYTMYTMYTMYMFLSYSVHHVHHVHLYVHLYACIYILYTQKI